MEESVQSDPASAPEVLTVVSFIFIYFFPYFFFLFFFCLHVRNVPGMKTEDGYTLGNIRRSSGTRSRPHIR